MKQRSRAHLNRRKKNILWHKKQDITWALTQLARLGCIAHEAYWSAKVDIGSISKTQYEVYMNEVGLFTSKVSFADALQQLQASDKFISKCVLP